MSKNPVVHFEMPYKDKKRASMFYSKVFGWDMIDAGEAMGHYLVAHTAETDKDNMVKTPGTINGGFYDSRASKYQEPSVVISVDDLKKSAKDVEEAGGKMLSEPQMIPGVGLWASFEDSEKNRVSMLQPMKM